MTDRRCISRDKKDQLIGVNEEDMLKKVRGTVDRNTDAIVKMKRDGSYVVLAYRPEVV